MAWNAERPARDTAQCRRVALVALLAIASTAAVATATPPTQAAPAYALSAPFNEIRHADAGMPWSGEHRFGDVFCLRFPDPADSAALAETMFNDNTLYFSRVEYPNRRLNLYVVTSRLPATLDRDGEHAAQRMIAQQYVAQIPTHAEAGEMPTALGTSVTLRLRNVVQGDGSAPFPFERRFAGEPDSPLRTLSTHRLFSNNGSRLELAALQAFEPALTAGEEAAAAKALDAFVDRAAASLAECTAALPEQAR
ncbi:MAG: hypothetical protein ACRC2H_04070 [Silanimonas sp.]